MTPKPLSADIAADLDAAGDQPVPVTKPNDTKLFFVVDGEFLERAKRAMRESEVVASVQRGVTDPGMSLEESQERTVTAIRQPQQ
ncbi:MAG: hypothetical protein AAGG48_29190 [Planctomycetota bacterium]